jgi:virulence factor Mce-like protein
MISKRVIANLVAFFVVSFGLVAYGALTLLGNPMADRRTVTTVFPDASGVLEDFSASMNGVVIGKVTAVDLVDDGVQVTVELDPGKELPGDVEASIVRASAVGEQRVEFTPTDGGTAEPVPDGGVVPASEGSTPPEISEVLDTANALMEEIPPGDLNTVIHELALALRGREEDLRSLTRNVDVFNREFLEHEEEFRQLLATSPELLDALTEVAPELRSAFANTAEFTGVLADRRHDLTALMEHGTQATATADELITGASPNLACLTHDFADLAASANEAQNLDNLVYTLENNQSFFGPIDALAVYGHARGFPEYGSTERNDQGWLRVRLVFPPGQPAASRYSPIRATPDQRPGNACINDFGSGAAAASQGAGAPTPVRDGGIDPATNEPIDLAPTTGPSGIGGDVDPAAVGTGDTPRGDDTEASASGDVTRDEPTEEATQAIRSDEEGDDGPGILLPLVGGMLLLAAAAGVVRLVQKLRT